MRNDIALQMMGELMWHALLIGAPILVLTMVVGLVVSIFQVVTQIQEMSLAFVPKLVAAVIALVIFGPWMLRKTLLYSTNLISNIPKYF